MEDAPTRFTIRPDDYHVPYAGTAEDVRLSRSPQLTRKVPSELGEWELLTLRWAGPRGHLSSAL